MNSPKGHFCILPWTHLSLGVTGSLHACCKSDHHSLGSLREKGFREIWNDEPARKMRRMLLAGEAPVQCADCHQAERLGARSLRQQVNEFFKESFPRIAETAPDGSVSPEGITYLQVRFSSLCNFRCRICDVSKSSGWAADARKMGEDVPEATLSLQGAAGPAWEMIDAVLPTLRRIYITGGEPLLHEEHYLLLEKLIARGRTDILLDYNINLSTLSRAGRDVLALWGKFKKVYVAMSLDGVGAQAELLRKGMDWDSAKLNFKRIRVFAPHVRLIVDPTLCAMNVFHITEAIDEWIRLGMVRQPWSLRFNFLLNPAHFRIQILNEPERQSLRKRYQDFLAGLEPRVDEALYQAIARQLQLVLNHFSEPTDWAARGGFRDITRKLDQLREESFAAVFPELADLVGA